MSTVRRNLTKAPKKKPTVTRAMAKSIDFKYIGDEPVDVHVKGYTNALNWYNYMFDVDTSRTFLIDYMKSFGYPKDKISAIKKAPKYAVPMTLGWIARILSNGNVIEQKSLNYLNSNIDEIYSKTFVVEEAPTEVEKPVVNIQDRTKAKTNLLITEIEERLDQDDWESFDVYDFLTGKEASTVAANAIRGYYIRIRDEVNEDDPDIKEAFGKRLKKERTFWNKFIADCDRFVGNVKSQKVRKPREKKTKSSVELVKNLKYQKEFPALKIVSVNPAEIIGASQLWVYNTKYRKITRYDAIGPAGLSVSGTTLTGFDEERSITKSLRKPELVIDNVLKSGKIALRKVLDDIKTNDSKPTGRINSDVVILRVIK